MPQNGAQQEDTFTPPKDEELIDFEPEPEDSEDDTYNESSSDTEETDEG